MSQFITLATKVLNHGALVSSCRMVRRTPTFSYQAARCLNASATPSNPEPPLPPPPIAGAADRAYPPKIQKIVDEISQLTLLEVADLNDCLKKTLNIPDTPMMAVGAPMAGGAAPKAEEEDDDAGKKAVKTAFTVKLTKFDDSKKVALIKEIKNQLENMNLVQAKQFVEKVPQIVKADLAKDEADKLKALLEAAGGTVEIV